jgi:hypothetical protein
MIFTQRLTKNEVESVRRPCRDKSGQCPRLGLALLLAVFACAPRTGTPASRESHEALFAQAGAAYQKGDFQEAERDYRLLVEKGLRSGALYYNLGNSCFKQKKLGDAVYYWEMAKRLLPEDPDVRENLELANLLVVDRIEVPQDPLPIRWLDSAVHRLTIQQEGKILLALFIFANVLIAIFLLSGNPRLASRALIAAAAAGIIVAILGMSFGWKIYEKSHRAEGVVIEQKADARSGPGPENITVFTVHEGIVLRIRGESGGWYQISLPNGWSGWLPKDSVRAISD